MKYGHLVKTLNDEGVALHTLASLPHISVAGAVATATHGSGVTCGNLATAVAGLEIVTSGGEIIRASRGNPDFDGLVVGLGALGAVTRITLDVQPSYEVKQRVFEGLAGRRSPTTSTRSPPVATASASSRAGARCMTRSGSRAGRMNPTGLRVTSSARWQQRLIGTRLSNSIRPRVRRSWAGLALVRPLTAFPHGLHTQQRQRNPVGVPRPAPACLWGYRSRARPRRPDPTTPAGERDSQDGRGSAVDEHEL